MEEQHFTDGIGKISVIGGVVRLDLMTYSATETDAAGGARPVLTQRLVMGTEAFLRSSEKILEAVQLLTRSRTAKAPEPQLKAVAPEPQRQTVPPQPRAPVPAPAKIEQPAGPRPMPSPWSEPLAPKLPFP